MKTILIDLLVCGLLLLAVVLVPTLWHDARSSTNCGKLYFHILDAAPESSNQQGEMLLGVYSLEVSDRDDSTYQEVTPYALGEGWYIVDNCSPQKKILISRRGTGMEIVADEMMSRPGPDVVIDGIRLRNGVFALRLDQRAGRFAGSIPGQTCDDCFDITPADWDRARTSPGAVFR